MGFRVFNYGLIVWGLLDNSGKFIHACNYRVHCFPVFKYLHCLKVKISNQENLVYLLSRSENNKGPTVSPHQVLIHLFIYRDVGVVGQGGLEMRHRLQGQVHLQVDHTPVVYAEYEQHLGAARVVEVRYVNLCNNIF